jgi:hypothetical protein
MRNSSAIKPDEKVEVVVPVAVIEYVPNRISFLGHMKCKPDGQIIIMKLDGERVLNKSAGLLGKLGFLGPCIHLCSLHHLQYFTTPSLTETFFRARLRVKVIWHHNFPLRRIDIVAKSII